MITIQQFIETVNHSLGIGLPESWASLSESQIAQRFLAKVNEYFFQTYEGIGYTNFGDDELPYFSEFHKYWETHHPQILDPKIDASQARTVATCLSDAVERYGEGILRVTHDTAGLPSRAIAQVRFFTANQDFREPPEDQFNKYLEDPARFDASEIVADPADFLRFLGMTRLSQTDKRLDYAHNAAKFLLGKEIQAYDIAERMGNDAESIRNELVGIQNAGYGSKKANMFIRDMYELGAWPELEGMHAIDVASDINTMKLALRTRILVPAVPLLSSFLDVFCYQYSYIDKMSAQAWRMVWNQWGETHPATATASPCQMDFLLYRIGREYCKHTVVEYRCDNGHNFFHFGARLSRCRVCRPRANAYPQARFLPCQVRAADLPREDGLLLLPNDRLLKKFDGRCILEDACRPTEQNFVPFDPPKSISIKGQTGWTSAYTDRNRAGGGLMA